MSSTIEYRASMTPEPYEPAPMPEDIRPEDLEAFYDERDAAEKAREDAAEAHEAWKVQKQKEEKRRALELERREKKLAQERKVAEAKARKEREEREAAEKKRQEEAEAKAKAEVVGTEQRRLEEEARALEERRAAEKKKLEGEAKAKALVEASKAAEAEKEKGKVDGNEGSKVGSGSDGDDEWEKDPKGKALKKLVKQRKDRKGKGKATDSEAVDVSRKHKIKSSAVVVSGEEEVVRPSGRPLKKLKTEPEMQADDEEYKGNERCGRCKADDVKCFICCGRTCERCKLKKSKCVFSQAGSDEVVYLLQQLCDKMDNFQEGLERVEGKVDFLGSQVEEEFREEWAASKVELGNLKNVNSEALRISDA
ncbi:uncharacterized protein EV420DRAFT_1568957, partial [Desarmillaria tabescens]